MTFYAILDSRGGHPWVWEDSIHSFRKSAIDDLVAFVRATYRQYDGSTREQQLRTARRVGLRVVKVRVEVIA